MEDKVLVQRLLSKDSAAERLFFDQYGPKLRRIATFILGYNDSDIDDVVQETFLAVLQDLPGFQFRSSFFHWLRRICVFRCYERLRRRRKQAASADEEMERLTAEVAMAKARQKADEKVQDQLLEILRDERTALKGKCKELIELRDEQDKSYAELSKYFKVAIGTIMSRLARCKEELRQRVIRAAQKRGLVDG